MHKTKSTLVLPVVLTLALSSCGYVTVKSVEPVPPKTIKSITLNHGEEEERHVALEKSMQDKLQYLDPELYKVGLSNERLAQLLAKALPHFDKTAKVNSVERDKITVGKNVIFVENLAISLRGLPDEKSKRRAILLYLSTAINAAKIDTTDIKSLISIVRSSEQGAIYDSNQGVLIAPGLTRYYAFDTPESLMMARDSDLEKFKKSDADLLTLAKENLKTRFTKKADILLFDDGVKLLSAGSDFTACLLLFDDVMKDCQETQKGDLVFGIPSRGALFFADSSDNELIVRLRRSVQQAYDSDDHPVSKSLYTWKKGKVEIFN